MARLQRRRLLILVTIATASARAGAIGPACDDAWDLFRSGYEVDVDRLRWPELGLQIPPPLPAVAPCARAKSWVLPTPLVQARRNHDCRILNERLLVTVLGRYGRTVEMRDLRLGGTRVVHSPGTDPAGWRLDDLNHVYGVRVRTLERRVGDELWLTCGFHGDRVNHEIASQYARIVDLATFSVRVGPKLPRAGGACAALALHLDGPDEPPHICSFGGTDGSHSNGTFIDTAHCYDRRRAAWHSPFDRLPYGLDHANAAYVQPTMCAAAEPGRVLLLNYRTHHYSAYRSEVLAHDLPPHEHTREAGGRGWYVYALPVIKSYVDPVNAPRDASGLVTASNGRFLLNFGGLNYGNTTRLDAIAKARGRKVRKKRPHPFDNIRAFDVCTRQWKLVGEHRSLGMPLFALQTCASAARGVAITCGGAGPITWQPGNATVERMIQLVRDDAAQGRPSRGDVLAKVDPSLLVGGRRIPIRAHVTADNSNFHFCIVTRLPAEAIGPLDTR